MAERVLKGTTKLLAYAGSAKPNPKMGQALGPLGLNMMAFCKEFNEKTSNLRTDVPVRIVLKAYKDRSYDYVCKPPPTSWFIKRLGQMGQGSYHPGVRYFGKIGVKYIYEVAKIKKNFDPDFKHHSTMGICKMIIAQMNSMGFRPCRNQEIPRIVTPYKI